MTNFTNLFLLIYDRIGIISLMDEYSMKIIMAQIIRKSLIFVLLLIMSQTSLGQAEANSVSNCFKKVKEVFPPSWEIREHWKDWEIIYADNKPSVSVQGQDGYRCVLQNCIPPENHPNLDVSETVTRYNHIDLVLFSDDYQFDDKFKQKIPWLELKKIGHTKPVYMGTRDGFHWFINTTAEYQEEIRERLKLTGGDDRIEILLEALTLNLSGYYNDPLETLLSEYGDEAIPYIKRYIDRYTQKDPDKSLERCFYVLRRIRTDLSTQLLKDQYASPKTRQFATIALSYGTCREAAKDEYIDILKQGIYDSLTVKNIMDGCIKYAWEEALPYIEGIYAKPKRWDNLLDAYLCIREFKGQPVSDELLKAYYTIRSCYQNDGPEDIEKAKNILVESSDTESVTLMSIGLVLQKHGAKPGVRPICAHNAGWEVLRMLPEETAKPLVDHISKALENSEDLINIQELKQIYEDHYSK